uniref:hypothetical protein n=1 Tax=Falsiroseomonas oryzae TaxID=2766473 RepID=UPI0022EAE14F
RERLAAEGAAAGAPAPPRVALVPRDGSAIALEVEVPLGVTSAEAAHAAQEALILLVMRTLEERAA